MRPRQRFRRIRRRPPRRDQLCNLRFHVVVYCLVVPDAKAVRVLGSRSHFHHCMKDHRILLATIFCSLATLSTNAADRPGAGELQSVVATVGQILEQAHYTRHKLDASMGKQILEAYLESLDLNRLFFTQEDIDEIRNAYGPSLNDDILLGNLTPAKNIFAIFRQRVTDPLLILCIRISIRSRRWSLAKADRSSVSNLFPPARRTRPNSR